MKRALILFLLSTQLYAIGLGDMTIHSQLNEPFSAEIALTDVGKVPLSSLKPGLGTTEALDNAGLTSVLLAAAMHLQVMQQPDGAPVIQLVSEHPIAQESLELLIDLAWPQGEVYRAYPVTLTAPVLYSQLPAINDWFMLQVAKNQVNGLMHQQQVLEQKLKMVLIENQQLQQAQHGHGLSWVTILLLLAGVGAIIRAGYRQWARKPKIETGDSTVLTAFHDDEADPTVPTEQPPPLVKSQEALGTLLELSKTYFSRGDFQTAKQALKEALAFGNETQQAEAQALLEEVETKHHAEV